MAPIKSAAATAEQIRTRPIFVNLPGTDLRIECRRPDPLELISSGLLKLDAFGSVLEQIAETFQVIQATAAIDNRPVKTDTKPQTYNDFLDLWCATVVVSPKVVLVEEDAIYDPSALWVKELDFDIKGEIFAKTMGVLASPRVLQAVKSFRLGRSAGVGAGSDGAAVRDDAVAAAVRG